MAGRKISKEVEQMFDKYVTNFCRRLKKDAALRMLQTEFNLSERDALVIFEVCDKDHNEELSFWEFNQFYNTIGGDANKYLTMFEELQKDHSGHADIDQLFDILKDMKAADGSSLTEQEIAMYIKTTAGTEKQIDLPKFINLMCRVKVHRGSKS